MDKSWAPDPLNDTNNLLNTTTERPLPSNGDNHLLRGGGDGGDGNGVYHEVHCALEQRVARKQRPLQRAVHLRVPGISFVAACVHRLSVGLG